MKVSGTITLFLAVLISGMAQADCEGIAIRMHITQADHFSSSGSRITEAAGILQQNLFYVNTGVRVDAFDTPDEIFRTPEDRASFFKAANSYLNPAQKARIEDFRREEVVTIGVGGCMDHEKGIKNFAIEHLNISEINSEGFEAPFMSATDDLSFESEQYSYLLSEHFDDEILEFSVAYLVNADAKLLMLDSSMWCGTLGCNAVMLDSFDNIMWEGHLAEAIVVPTRNGADVHLYNGRAERTEISLGQ